MFNRTPSHPFLSSTTIKEEEWEQYTKENLLKHNLNPHLKLSCKFVILFLLHITCNYVLKFVRNFLCLIYPKDSCVYFNYHYNIINEEKGLFALKRNYPLLIIVNFPFILYFTLDPFLCPLDGWLKNFYCVLFFRCSVSSAYIRIHWRTNNTSRICAKVVMCVVWWESFGNIGLVQKR